MNISTLHRFPQKKMHRGNEFSLQHKTGINSPERSGLEPQRGVGILLLMLLAAVIAMTAGCAADGNPATASLTIHLTDQPVSSRSLLPDTPLTVDYYTVEGAGPDGETFSVSTSGASVSVPGLQTGSWTLTASGWNEDDCRLITGETTFELTPGSTTASITLDEYYGSGTLSVIINWDAEKTYNPEFYLYLTQVGNSETEVTPTIAADSASFETTLDAGTYYLRGVIYSEGEPKGGFIEAVRITDSQTTGGTITIDMDTLVSELSVSLQDTYVTLVEGTITGIPETVNAGTELTLTFEPVGLTPEQEGALSAVWYFNGEHAGIGTTMVITPEAGIHRIDVIASAGDLKSSGSASSVFTAIGSDGGQGPGNGIVIGETVISDGEDGNKLDGIEHVIVLPDNLIVAASRVDDVIQTYRLESGALQLLQTFTYSETMPLNGVQELAASDDGTLIGAISDYSKSLVLFSHVPGTDTIAVEEIFSDPFTFGGVDYSIGLLSNIAIDSENGHIFVNDRFNFAIYHFYFDETGVVPIESYSFVTDPMIEQPKAIAISPDGTRMAVPSYGSNALFFFDIDPSTGVPTINTILSYAGTGTMGVGSVNSALFIDNSTVLTTSNDYLCEFSYGEPSPGDEAAWHQTWRLSEGSEITTMSGPKHVTLTQAGDRVFVSTSISDGMTIFSRDTGTGTLTYEAFHETAPADPVMSALTADDSHLIIPSSVTDELVLLTLSSGE